MPMNEKQIAKMLRMSILIRYGAAWIGSMAILMIPLNGSEKGISRILAGIMFWGAMVLLIQGTILGNYCRKAMKKGSGARKSRSHVGFFTDPKTAVSFAVSAVAAIILILSAWLELLGSTATFVFIALFFLSFCLMMIWNSRSYKVYNEIKDKKKGA